MQLYFYCRHIRIIIYWIKSQFTARLKGDNILFASARVSSIFLNKISKSFSDTMLSYSLWWILVFKWTETSAFAWNLFLHKGHWCGQRFLGRCVIICFFKDDWLVKNASHISGHSMVDFELWDLDLWIFKDFTVLYFLKHWSHFDNFLSFWQLIFKKYSN